jgi:hypothetical protein
VAGISSGEGGAEQGVDHCGKWVLHKGGGHGHGELGINLVAVSTKSGACSLLPRVVRNEGQVAADSSMLELVVLELCMVYMCTVYGNMCFILEWRTMAEGDQCIAVSVVWAGCGRQSCAE